MTNTQEKSVEISLQKQPKPEREAYYIIGNYQPSNGLFAMFKHTIAHVLYALENGYTPVIDMRCHYCQYFKDGREYKDNPWEYFFKQPAGISPQDIDINDNTILCLGGKAENKYQIFPTLLPLSKENLCEKHPYLSYYHQFLQFSDEIQTYLDKNLKQIFKSEKDILGIIVRGSDFVETKPKGHAIQPTAEMIIEKVKELQQTLTFKKIYLATEDANIYAKIKAAFGDMLIENTQYKYETVGGERIYKVKAERKDHFYNLGKEYLLSVYLLSKCKYLIGGRANGTVATYMLTNGFSGYDYVYLWDLGCYGVNNTPKEKIIKSTIHILGLPFIKVRKNTNSYKVSVFKVPVLKITSQRIK